MAMAAGPPPLYTFGTPWPVLNEGVLYTDVVKSSSSDETLLHYYASRFKDSASEQGWLQRIRNGQIKVNGQVTTSPDAKLSFGSTIVYHRLPWSEPSAPYEIPVLFEDLHLIAINKPSGLQVLPGGLFQQRTVLQQLQWLSSALSQKLEDPSNVDVSQPTPVHRLGRGTSGVLLCAKTPESKSRLAADFAGSTSLCSERIPNVNTETIRRMTKTYRALVKGVLQNEKMVIDQPIGRLKYPGVSGGLYMASSTGKAAQSTVSVVWRDETEQTTLVEVEIFSGRPHQIRIHMATIGHPLLGDPLYVEGGKPSVESRLDLEENATPAKDGGYAKPTSPVPGKRASRWMESELESEKGKAAEVQAEVERIKQLPSTSAYAAHRLRVLNKMLDLLAIHPKSADIVNSAPPSPSSASDALRACRGDELELLFSELSF